MSDQPSEYIPQDGDFYEAAFHLMTPAGVIVRYTVHAGGANECMKRQEFIIKNRLDGGYSVPAMGSGDGNKAGASKSVESQTYTGFMIKTDVVKGKKSTSIQLPFNLNNGEAAAYPHAVFGTAVEMFLKVIAEAGIEAATGEFYEIPIKATWTQGREMPKKNPDDPVKHYKDWQSFEILHPQTNKPPVKHPVKPPIQETEEQTEDIPF